jgi:hypothetical protein
MADGPIHVVPDDSFERGDAGHEFGDYPTRQAAELAQALTRRHQTELVIHLSDGRTSRKSCRKGWVARLFGR